MPAHEKSVFWDTSVGLSNFQYFSKNGLTMAVERLVEAVEALFENYFSNLIYFSKISLEVL